MKVALLAAIRRFLFLSSILHTRSTSGGARHGLTHVCIGLTLLCAWPLPLAETTQVEDVRLRLNESEVDAVLQRAATDSLGKREGTIIVLDAQTGRVRAVVNPRLAAQSVFPPGSAIKPFTLLAALRARAIEADARLSCRRHYARRGVDFTCSHPVYHPPFNSAQALAHSCNYYFARLAERLPHEEFNATLAAYNLGARPAGMIKAQQTKDALPRLPQGRWQLGTALGEGDELLVTPLQLIAATAALFNGGHLYQTQIAAPENFRPHELARLDVTPAQRALLLAGLRGAVKYGTASAADLAPLPNHIFGKTGTATEIDTLHTHGWFVGFANEGKQDKLSTNAGKLSEETAPTQVKLAVLVFLKRGQGKQSAEIARPIFAAHARLTSANGDPASRPSVERAASGRATPNNSATATQTIDSLPLVRVRLAQEEVTLAISLDDYLFGALAAESSIENEFAALKAQAVVSRTYALAKLRRHARDGFDFCNTTHCQRFLPVRAENARPDFHELVRRAVRETTGEVLRDGRGNLAREIYFSASCGGQTANFQTLWGTPAREPYQRGGVPDEYCAAMPHKRWTNSIPAAQLVKALREDERTDVGGRVEQISVVKRDATGRAEQLAIAGERRRVLVSGWNFKIIIGRTLGWSVLKSSRFEVMRAGDKFIFRGSGFGHGLGLCQSGAHVMAARGSSYRHILAHYFPGTNIGSAFELKKTARAQKGAQTQTPQFLESVALRNPASQTATSKPANFVPRMTGRSGSSAAHARFAHAHVVTAPPQARLILASENFRANYPAHGGAEARRDVERALASLEAGQADMRRRLASASLSLPALGTLEIFVHETTGHFMGATGKPAWVAATTHNRRIELQPLAALRRRGILTTTLRHEYAHVVIDALARGRAPLWLAEGLAAYVAGEGAMLSRAALKQNEAKQKLSREELGRRLSQFNSAAEMRALYVAAFREVEALIRAEGEASVWRRLGRD